MSLVSLLKRSHKMTSNKYLISPDKNIITAIELLNEVTPKLLLVIKNSVVYGTISDGDIRRGLLSGATLFDSCSDIMKENFQSINLADYNNTARSLLNSKFKDWKVIPIIEGVKLHSIYLPDQFDDIIENAHQSVALIMAGGFGSRMGNLTETTPKALLKVLGVPLIERIVKKLAITRIKTIYVSTYYLKEKIIDYLGNGEKYGVNIIYLHEESPLGTGGALRLIQERNFDNILITNCDILTDLNFDNFLNFHIKQEAIATMAIKEHIIMNPYGVVDFNHIDFIATLEKPIYKSFVNAGMYLLNIEALKLLGDTGRIDMPDIFEKLVTLEYKPKVFPIHENWGDIGTQNDLNIVNSHSINKK
jgi:dTDP-glucose pyrophosphorylase